MKRFAVVVLCSLSMMSANLHASEAADRDPGREAMDALPPIEGVWEGSGWMRRGPGDPVEFVGQETVESRLGRRVILIEGKHYTPDRSQVVHHAFALLKWDQESGGYRFLTTLENGRGGDFPAKLEDGALVWSLEGGPMPMRYIIRIEGDTWHEIGEMNREGAWTQFFEMTLQRKK